MHDQHLRSAAQVYNSNQTFGADLSLVSVFLSLPEPNPCIELNSADFPVPPSENKILNIIVLN